MPTSTLTRVPRDYPRRWSHMVAITLTDTNSTKNLMLNGEVPYKWLHNAGTSGSFKCAFVLADDDTTSPKIYIPQGGFVEGGQWLNARSTSATAGIELYGLVGDEGMG